jgi:RNA recognition motif-containing protein
MNIFVGNLSPEVTEDELRQEFARFGEVTSVTITKDQYRAYAFVEMARYSQSEAAIAGLNGEMLRNRVLSVIEALPLSHFPRRG